MPTDVKFNNIITFEEFLDYAGEITISENEVRQLITDASDLIYSVSKGKGFRMIK